jgi:hypothetical protein
LNFDVAISETFFIGVAISSNSKGSIEFASTMAYPDLVFGHLSFFPLR